MDIRDQLAGLRQFLERLESGAMSIGVNGVDVTKRELDVLKREISHLEAVLARPGR